MGLWRLRLILVVRLAMTYDAMCRADGLVAVLLARDLL